MIVSYINTSDQISAPKMDAFKNNNEDFYKDILKGKADVSDFERYVYGNSS